MESPRQELKMSKIEKIGFIGAGKMGSALLAGVLRAKIVPAGKVLISEIDQARRDEICKKHRVRSASLDELARSCGTILICVKPNVVAPVLREIREFVGEEKLVVSIAAGITTTSIETELKPGVPVVRVMPNIAATVGESATALAAGKAAGAEHIELARNILGSVGIVVELPEKLIDAVTGLSGSGPAYVFLFAEALLSGALKVGLPAKEARELMVMTIKGAAAMLEADKGSHPAVLRDAVTSPGGTTIAGLHELESKGFRNAVIRAVEAATERSQELGKS